MPRGVWKCLRMGFEKYGIRSSRPGGPGCDRWNVYISNGNRGGGVADVRCKTCGKRAKFRLRIPGDEHRGRARVVTYLSRPDSMPPHALLAEVRQRNRYQATGEEIEAIDAGFVRASELIEDEKI